MLQLLKITTNLKSHEEHFVERYERLLGWALHLTDHDRAQAEDLLHDAFIQFTLTAPELDGIRNLDNYLFGVLRILRVSQLRRSSRQRLQQLSIIEYDSAELGLRMIDQTVDASELLKIQDELRAVCRYACARKESSKAGSVLILRFFHGYYPSEIAAVLRSSRKVVDMRLQAARREARTYCAAPERLSFINAAKPAPKKKDTKKGGTNMTTQTADDLLLELRNEIFRARNDECFAPEELRRIYGNGNSQGEANGMDNRHLSHIVSCAICLDAVNQILGLPGLAERHPNDTIHSNKGGPDKGGPNSGGGATGGGSIERQAQHRAREVFEHRPQELFISVNGLILGSQKIHAELNEQTLELRPEDLAEPASFIEVFSEQGLRLLLMPVEAPVNDTGEQALKIVLSDERELEVSLQFRDPHPVLDVSYCDPLMKPEGFGVPASVGIVNSELFRLKAALKAFFLWPKRFAVHPRWQPRFAVVTLGLLLSATALLWRGRVTPGVTAAELLQKSIAAETQTAAVQGQVTHRSFWLEKRDPATARIFSSHRVEVWQSADRGITVRRIYDTQNRVIAGEWRTSDGTSKLYQRKENDSLTPLNSELWRTALTSRSFADLVGSSSATIEDQGKVYVLSYEHPENRELLKATLTLNKSDLRAIEQSLLLRDSTAGEFRAIESAFEQLPTEAVSPAIFQPDTELLDSGAKLIETPSTKSMPEAGASPVVPVATTKQAELMALEIEARYLLDQVNANLGEQISFKHDTGRLRIAALVETDKRKAELLSALAPLRANPAAAFDIATYAEAARREPQPNTSSGLTMSEFETSRNQIPAAAELRRYFAAQAPRSVGDDWIEAQIAQFASSIQRQAIKPLRHARALKTLIEQIPLAELETLNPDAKAKWRRMVQSHALAVQRETAALRVELQPIFFAAVSQETEATFSNAANLKQAAERLVALAASNDALISQMFSRSSANADALQLKSYRFRQSLREAEKLAENIFKQE